jgi:glycosyltransferase involved in cell wall biosynthesis
MKEGKRIRILCATPFYEPEGGGLERYAHEILKRLAARGDEVRVLCATRGPARQEQRQGVVVQRRPPRFFLGNSPIDPSLPGRLKQEIEELDPHTIVGHTPVPFPAEMAYRSARAAGIPFIPTYHAGRMRGSSIALDGLARIHRSTFERPMLRGSPRLIAASAYVRDHALRRHRDRVTVVPPGVDTKWFIPGGPERTKWPHRVLFVGPLSRTYQWKGVDVLWQAFKQVQKRFPEAELTLLGEGDRRAKFIRNAREQGINLRAPGRVGLDRLRREYQRAGLVVLPSISEAESFGMVLAEANACGLPVVASEIGGIPGFVRHRENGLLAPPGDVRALADRISQVLLDPEEARRMGQEGRRRVVQEHDWDTLAAVTRHVFQQAAKDPKESPVKPLSAPVVPWT